MPKPPAISVVIPAFNAAAVITETLDSVRRQTFQDFEVIIVDDGSPDDTAAVVQKICAQDPRFILVQQANGGVAVARNTGVAQARGEWIAFLDADDVWLPVKLESQMRCSRQDSGANFLYANYYFWDGQRDLAMHYRPRRPLPDGDPARALAASNVFNISTVMVRRELLANGFGFDPQLAQGCEDWDFYLRLTGRGLQARGTRTPLVRYRRWPGNMSGHKFKMAESAVLMLKKNIRATPRAELRPMLRRALRFVQAEREFIRARQSLPGAPEKIPAAIWRAWRLYPRKLKWLMWLAFVLWPKFLGGGVSSRFVQRKLIQKW
jgi:glycosyltransferase involved in cell wall biosynthesis